MVREQCRSGFQPDSPDAIGTYARYSPIDNCLEGEIIMKKIHCLLLGLIISLCSFAWADSDMVELRGAKVALKFSRAELGAVVSLRSAEGIELAAPGKAEPLFELCFSKAGEKDAKPYYVNSRGALAFQCAQESREGDQRATLSYEGFKDIPARVLCTARIQPEDGLVRWGIVVEVPQGWVLESVQYPCIRLASPLGSGGDDDAAVLGSTKGGIIRPAAMKTGATVNISQPGSMAAQFGCYYDDRAGFYTAAEDDRGYPKNLILARREEGVQIRWHRSMLATGTVTQDYEVVTGTFSGAHGEPADWRDAADIYKRWATTRAWCATPFAERKDLPEWLKQGPAMVRFGRHWLAEPERIERWVTEYWKKHFPAAPLITAYWGWEKHDSWVTPDYFPVYPSDEAFTALVDKTRKLGCHAFPWPSGYHWTLTYQKQSDGSFVWDDRERFDRIGRAHAVHNRDGSLYVRVPSWLQGGETACLCGGDPWTRNWWNEEICVPLVKRGCEMIQIDQVVGGRFPACYVAEHPHPPGPGAWMTDVFADQLRTMLAAMRAIEPEAVVCVEEPNEWFNGLVGLQDYRNCEVKSEWASVFNYIYHEYLPPFQSNPQRGDRVMAAHCLADGQMPHLVPSGQDLAEVVLANGGFEARTPGGNALAGWDQVPGYNGEIWSGQALSEREQIHGGQGALLLKNQSAADTVQLSQNLSTEKGSFEVGRQYRLSAWLKVETMAQENGINFGLFAPGLKSLGGGRLLFPAPGSGWQMVSADFKVPEGCEMMRIMIHVKGMAEARVDDMTLEEVLPGGETKELRYTGESSETSFMKQWVTLYHGRGRPWLQNGRLLHPPRLICKTLNYREREVPVVSHNAFRAADGREAVVLANATHEPQSVTLYRKGVPTEITVAADSAVLLEGPVY